MSFRAFLRKFVTLKPMKTLRNVRRAPINRMDPPRLFMLANSALLVENNLENIDLHLQLACEAGEDAIVALMDILKENLTSACNDYKACLAKEIAIIKDAINGGALSERWNDLPEYRTLAEELSQEVDKLAAILNTFVDMAQKQSLQYITSEKNHAKLIGTKSREVLAVLQKHLDEIKALEKVLLELKRESILKIKYEYPKRKQRKDTSSEVQEPNSLQE